MCGTTWWRNNSSRSLLEIISVLMGPANLAGVTNGDRGRPKGAEHPRLGTLARGTTSGEAAVGSRRPATVAHRGGMDGGGGAGLGAARGVAADHDLAAVAAAARRVLAVDRRTGSAGRRSLGSSPAGGEGAGAVGFVIAALVTLGLARFDLLRGPTILGFSNPAIESLLAGAAAVVLVLVGLPKAFTTPLTQSAWIGSERLASSTDVVIVEGNAYFPPSSVRRGGLTPSRTTSVCPWKRIARYYTVTADGVELTDAAWSYPHPLPFARRVKGRIAFRAGVDVGRE